MQLLATTLPVLLHLRQHMEELEEVSCNAEAWHALHRGRLLRAGQEPTLPQLNETQRSAQLDSTISFAKNAELTCYGVTGVQLFGDAQADPSRGRLECPMSMAEVYDIYVEGLRSSR